MERQELERRIVILQAHARGFLVRNVFACVRPDYEEIVKEIEGNLTHLDWRGSIIPKPYFTECTYPWQKRDVEVSQQSSKGHLKTQPDNQVMEVQEPHLQSETHVPERDCSQGKSYCCTSAVEDGDTGPAGGETEAVLCSGEPSLSSETKSRDEPVGGGVWQSMTETTSVWNSTAIDVSSSLLQKGYQTQCLVQNVPRTREAFRLHRNTLAMELLWLQQAIASRKKYLVLKQRLGSPDH